MKALCATFALLGLFSPPLLARQVTLPGLKEPVEILTDRWGVAPYLCQNEHVFFG